MDQRQIIERLQTALAHHQAGRGEDAARMYRAVLTVSPNNPDALHLLGVLEAQRGRPQEGLELLRRAVSAGPQVGDFHRHLGEVLHALGQRTEAVESFGRAVQIDPKDATARACAGAALLEMGDVARAAEQMRIVAEQRPNDAAALGNYGHVLARLGRTPQALAALKRAVEMDPNCASAWMQYAEAVWRAGRYEEAVPLARRAAEMLPNDSRAQVMLGNTLQTAGAMEAAEHVYRKAAELDPANFDAHSNLALTLLKQGEAQTALKLYDEVLTRWPGANDARANRSLALLTLGDFERGFAEYEARWASPHFAGHQGRGVMWDGGDVRGKTVLLTSEQGHGDTIHFVRYASLIADRGATVIVSCQESLAALVASVRGVSRVIGKNDPAPFDVYAPLASLPRLMHTTLQSVPAEVPYLHPDQALVAQWRKRFESDQNVKVGIVWAGTPAHQNDRVRSAKFSDFLPLLEVDGVVFYSLQKGPAAEQLSDPRVTALGDELTDYAQTAAAVQCLDLIISVDTSIVHLAGALARPVWTLLARGPDWRWMLGRDDSPWYPTMRLFRQETLHDWRGVMRRVVEELKGFVGRAM